MVDAPAEPSSLDSESSMKAHVSTLKQLLANASSVPFQSAAFSDDCNASWMASSPLEADCSSWQEANQPEKDTMGFYNGMGWETVSDGSSLPLEVGAQKSDLYSAFEWCSQWAGHEPQEPIAGLVGSWHANHWSPTPHATWVPWQTASGSEGPSGWGQQHAWQCPELALAVESEPNLDWKPANRPRWQCVEQCNWDQFRVQVTLMLANRCADEGPFRLRWARNAFGRKFGCALHPEALGHTKLLPLFEDQRLADVCRVKKIGDEVYLESVCE